MYKISPTFFLDKALYVKLISLEKSMFISNLISVTKIIFLMA